MFFYRQINRIQSIGVVIYLYEMMISSNKGNAKGFLGFCAKINI